MRHIGAAGEAYESVVRARKLLVAVHCVLGILTAISLWPLLPAQGLNIATSGSGLLKVIQTTLGWLPYVISGFYASSHLDGNRRAVVAFSVGSLAITAVAVSFYLNIYSLNNRPPLIFISIGVTICLIALARLCQRLWRPIAI